MAASWDRIETLFFAALERMPEARSAYLKEACADDPDLRREVEAMLFAHEESGSLHIEERLLAGPSTSRPEPESMAGKDVGPYHLKRLLGRGGMGEVYLAERADGQYEQHVALKLIRTGLHSAEILARFRMERQILAQLVHPNIAYLTDGGVTPEGRPYLVMPFVDGVPITLYCDTHRLPIDERLRLFRTVCTAVQFAHRNMVVHRDLKPSNILVTEEGVVKLLDFGIAKLLDAEAGEGPMTRADVRVMTPEYAAPEQIRGEAVTTATDVYALGVLLFELLTGHNPHRTPQRSDASGDREGREPRRLRPSVRLAHTDKTGPDSSLEAVSAARSTTPRRLRRRLHGDLDNIVMMALREEPERRYASADQFAEDIERYLSGRPVIARKDTAAYRLRKFIRRHRLGVGMAAAVIVLILGFTGAILMQARTVALQRDVARVERDKATRVAAFLQNVFSAADPALSRGDALTARELLDQGAARIEAELADAPAVKADLMQTIGGAYQSLALYDEAERMLDEALALRQAMPATPPGDIAEGMVALGTLYLKRSRFREADSLIRAALAMHTHLSTPDPTALARAQARLADVRVASGHYAEAEQLYRTALATLEAHYGSDHPDVLEVMNDLAGVRQAQDAFAEAEAIMHTVLERRRRRYGERHVSVLASKRSLADLYREQDRFDEARSLYEEVLADSRRIYGPNHPAEAAALADLGTLAMDLGAYDEAISHYEQAIQLAEATLGTHHLTPLGYRSNLASVYLYQGRYAEARDLLQETLARTLPLVGENHPGMADMRSNLSFALGYLGDMEGSERELRKVLAIERALYGPRHTEVATTLSSLSTLLWDRQAHQEAIAMAEEALALRRALLPPGHTQLANSLFSLGTMYMTARTLEEARPLLEEALAIYEARYPAGHLTTTNPQMKLARIAFEQGRIDEAEERVRAVLEARAAVLDADDWRVWQGRSLLGAILTARGRYDEARELLEACYARWGDPSAGWPEMAADLRRWLEALREAHRFPDRP
ncbi:MAG: hypothetical protein D6746_00770 [Bacteroidetes bacterium]|nr:MAG: hypothetical protein D6746_00770 [Bacteroidota bacterium]